MLAESLIVCVCVCVVAGGGSSGSAAPRSEEYVVGDWVMAAEAPAERT